MNAPNPNLEQSEAYEDALEFLLKQEGGYVNNPADPGGETNLGISKMSYPEENIADMTRQRAAFLYHRDYWLPNRCEEMPPRVGLALFDFAVNAPAKAARMALQEVIGAHPDGALGPKSMGALAAKVAKRGDLWVALKLIDKRLVRYIRRVQAGSSSAKFLLGWMRRLHHLITAVHEHKGER